MRAYRHEVSTSWFSLARERRDFFRACPFLDFPVQLESLSLKVRLRVALRIAYHAAVRDEAYFRALREHYQEAGRLAEAIRQKIEEETFLQTRLADEASDQNLWPEERCTDGRGSPLDTKALRARREARKSAKRTP
jgi:hypothetical protein